MTAEKHVMKDGDWSQNVFTITHNSMLVPKTQLNYKVLKRYSKILEQAPQRYIGICAIASHTVWGLDCTSKTEPTQKLAFSIIGNFFLNMLLCLLMLMMMMPNLYSSIYNM